jgi:hypothetical protein
VGLVVVSSERWECEVRRRREPRQCTLSELSFLLPGARDDSCRDADSDNDEDGDDDNDEDGDDDNDEDGDSDSDNDEDGDDDQEGRRETATALPRWLSA